MQAACDISFEYAHMRKAFGKPIGQFQVLKCQLRWLFVLNIFLLSYYKEKWLTCTLH